jgi:ADP-ribose pyrophosphatase YjhB (NUDIX family)
MIGFDGAAPVPALQACRHSQPRQSCYAVVGGPAFSGQLN